MDDIGDQMVLAVKRAPLRRARPNFSSTTAVAVCFALAAALACSTSIAHAASRNTHLNRLPVLLCDEYRDAIANNLELRQAATAAFGKDLRFQVPESSGGCTSFAALLRFAGAKVLITATTDTGDASPSLTAHFSAYFLRDLGNQLRLVASKENFADSRRPWGNVGEITAAHFGSDDGMMITADTSQQGYSNEQTDFYAFRNGDIVSLGMVPTGWSNDGAAATKSEAVNITAKIETGLQRPDSLRVTYTKSAYGKDDQTSIAIWRSQAGKFTLTAGSIPNEIVENFDLNADVFAKSGAAIDAIDAAPSVAVSEQQQDRWSINDVGMAEPPPQIIEAIKKDPSYPSICKLSGREMLPSLSEGTANWFVTTSNRCDAGGGVAPAWIVSVALSAKASVILSQFLRAVKIQEGRHEDFRDIIVNDNSKFPDSGDPYIFDGTSYRRAKS